MLYLFGPNKSRFEVKIKFKNPVIFCPRFFSTDIYVFRSAESIPAITEVKNTGFDDLLAIFRVKMTLF